MDFASLDLVKVLSGWSAFMILCFSLVRAVTKGDIVPGARYTELREDHAELKKDYKALAGLIDTVLEQGKTTVSLLQSIRAAAENPKVGDRT
jgi:hypothetical protein